jgi:hypothetical protein
MMASTPAELIAGFLHSSLPKVTGELTFEDLNFIWRILNTNAISVASYKGGGRHGHLGIIMTNEEYFAITVDIFPVPNNPGPSAAVVTGTTAAVIAETTRLHREATQVYPTYHIVNQAIKKFIIESFDDAYLNALLDEIVGYTNGNYAITNAVSPSLKIKSRFPKTEKCDVRFPRSEITLVASQFETEI